MNIQNTFFSLLVLFGFSLTATAMEHTGEFNLDVDGITYLEVEEAVNLDFDTAAYLPADFNPYAAPSNFRHVSFIEDTVEIDLGFNPEDYLPEGFDPHRFFFDIHSIEYIEEEELLDIDLVILNQIPASGTILLMDKSTVIGS